MPKLFSQVVSKIPEELSTKSNRKNEERLLKLNAGKRFHFFFPSTGDHHSIELNSKFWPKDLNYSERLKFANAPGSNKKLPLRYDEGTFHAKFIGVTDSEDSERQVLTQVENRIDNVSSTEMVDLTFSDLHEELPDSSKSQNCKSQPPQKKDGDIVSFFSGKRKATEPVQSGSKSIRVESDNESINLSDNEETHQPNQEAETAMINDVNDEPEVSENVEVAVNQVQNKRLVETLESVCETLKLVTEALNIQRRDSRNIRKLLDSNAPEVSAQPTPKASACEQFIEGGEVLNKLPGSTPGKFGINLFKRLFTLDERIRGIAQPEKATKPALDPERMEKIQKMVEERFPGQWYLARKSINDCARDSKKVKKRLMDASAENFEKEDLDASKENDGFGVVTEG